MPMDHTYIIGQSGSGKSTLMKDRLLSDIYAGNGVFYLDPHGPDTDDLLQYIPYERRNDVVLFDPSDTDRTIAWNPLEIEGHIALITSAFERGLKDASGYSSVSTPTMSLYIRNSVYALIEAKEPLTGFPFMLTSPAYRKSILERVHDPLIKRFWKDFEVLTPKERRQEIASTYNKAYSIIIDHRIRNILGQRKSAFSISDVLNGKILFARLPQGQLGFEQVRVLGILLLSQLHLTALNKAATVPTSVYIDEAHTFDGGTLCEMLSGIRKYNVGLTLAHQNLDQLSTELRASILSNVARKFVFRVSIKDSLAINEHVGPDNVYTELYKLPPFKARRFEGIERAEEDIEPIDYPTDDRVPRIIRSNMKRNYARPADIVTEEINRYIENA